MKAWGPGGVLGINCPTSLAEEWKNTMGEINNVKENRKVITAKPALG